LNKTPYIKYKNLYIIPTFHSRIEFTKLVHEAFYQVSPDLIAVELPNNVQDEIYEGIKRLPFLSMITYADSLNPKQLNFIPIDPGDSIIEALRLGIDNSIPTELIDLSVTDYEPQPMQLPDDYSIVHIGLIHFYEQIKKTYILKNDEIKKQKREYITLESYFEDKDNPDEELDFLDKDILREKYMAGYLNRLMPLYHRILFVVGMAHWEQIKYYLDHPDMIQDVDIELLPHKYVKIYNIKSSDARFLLRELPYNTYKWIKFRDSVNEDFLEQLESPEQLIDLIKKFNRVDHIRKIYIKAKRDFEEEFKEFIDLHRLKSIFQYVRNLTLTEKRLIPDLFTLLTAAKNIVDDDYAWKVLDQATKYPFNDEYKDYETMRLSQNIGRDPNGRYLKLRSRHPYQYGQERDLPMEQRPEEKYPGEWREKWEDDSWNTVSYPPEDLIEEDYFSFIRKKAIKNLKNQRVNIEEFKSSLMDGIDIKETIRNWPYKKKIYVRNEQQIQGKMDTIIVIFDKDEGEVEKYPYCLTWWAEHNKESDLPFYSTYPGDYLIGPGISHVEVGGLLSIFPPIQIPEIWKPYMDYNFKDVKNKAERLLKAAILYSKEKFIAYIASEPPRKYYYSLAAVKHRQIVYIPLDHFNKESLKTIKHIHILAGKDKRAIANRYIHLG